MASNKKNRKDKYLTYTEIVNIGGKKIFRKSAGSYLATDFIKKIIKKEELSVKFFNDKATVVRGVLKGNSIDYPFYNLPTLEELILRDIRIGDENYGLSHINDYISFIKDLSIKKCYPKEFMKALTINSNAIKKRVNCLHFAPLDCIPCNILVNKKEWLIIDMEWTFEYPLPVDFLIYRAIYSLIIHLQNEIQLRVSPKRPLTLFQGYGKNRTYVPSKWLYLLGSLDIPVPTLHYWEFLFQKVISEKTKRARLRLKKSPREIYFLKRNFFLEVIISGISRLRRIN